MYLILLTILGLALVFVLIWIFTRLAFGWSFKKYCRRVLDTF
ncbi:MAG TPA: hypothetical protein VJ983_07590 [candidate division Zixibacteria bacterium]|nr:hypothetical protein [candidate division Zixibacteria bacterium]